MDTDKAIKKPKALLRKKWDLALVIDVSVPKRIGDANTMLLKHAKVVAVIDHHVTDPRPRISI